MMTKTQKDMSNLTIFSLWLKAIGLMLEPIFYTHVWFGPKSNCLVVRAVACVTGRVGFNPGTLHKILENSAQV